MGKIPFIKMKGKGCLYYIIIFPFLLIINLYIGLFALLWFAIKWIWQKATATPESRKVSAIAVGGFSVFICGFMGMSAFLQSIGVLPTSTPMPTTNLNEAIQNTAQAALYQGFTQTALAIPTNTTTALATQTFAPLPTASVIPTFTDVPTIVVIIPTNPPASGSVCSCAGDTLNCSDFSSYSSANACFNYCISVGAGDIHRLDGNNDGSACDSLK